jgi:hypothetical protein
MAAFEAAKVKGITAGIEGYGETRHWPGLPSRNS